MNSHGTENNESPAESIQALRQEIKELKLKVSNDRGRQKPNNNDSTCFNCGQSWPHQGNTCSTKNKQCHSCGKYNYFKSVCRSSKRTQELLKPLRRYSRPLNQLEETGTLFSTDYNRRDAS